MQLSYMRRPLSVTPASITALAATRDAARPPLFPGDAHVGVGMPPKFPEVQGPGVHLEAEPAQPIGHEPLDTRLLSTVARDRHQLARKTGDVLPVYVVGHAR